MSKAHCRFSQRLIIAIFFCAASLIGLPSQASSSQQERLISTDANATQILFKLGMGDKIIAVDVTSKLPAQADSLPNVGYHRRLSGEGLLSLNPSLVIGSNHMGPPEALNALKQANIGLLQLNSPDSPQKLQDNIKKLSTVLNKTAEGKRLMAHVESLSSQLNTHAFAKENVAFLLTMSDNKLRLAGRGTSGDAMINLMSGAKNVADFDNYRTVTAESLLALSPTIILVVSRQQDNALSSLMAAHPSLNYTPAAKHGHLYSIAGDSLIAGLSVKAIEEVLRIQNQVRLQQADAQQ